MYKYFLIALLLPWGAMAQSSYPQPTSNIQSDIGQTNVPTTLSAVASQDAYLLAGDFYNSTGSSITLTLTDQSTTCGGSACSRSFAIAAGQSWYPSWPGTRYRGGIKWSASATGLMGWMRWRY